MAHWPFLNSVDDVVNNVSLNCSGCIPSAQNHLGMPNSALYFPGDKYYCNAASNSYFYGGPFTASVWVYINSTSNTFSTGSYPIFNFGNSDKTNNVWFGFVVHIDSTLYYDKTECGFRVAIGEGVSTYEDLVSYDLSSLLNTWTLLTAVHDGILLKLYLNGGVMVSKAMNPPKHIGRYSNFIGYSNWDEYGASIIIDDLRIYDRDLNSNEVASLFNLGNIKRMVKLVNPKS